MRLVLEGVSHAFLGRPVFEQLLLSLGEGEVVALVGPSGCGKTTVLQIAAGLIDPLRGRVRRLYRRHAVVFQDPRLLPWMNARDNIGYGLAVRGTGKSERHAIAESRAAEVGLFPRDLDKYPAELSGGMRQRVAVARALAVSPDVVYFDEPFTAIDVGLRRVLQNLLIAAAQREKFSALFVTHDLTEAVRLADRIIVLSGRQEGIIAERVLDGAPGTRDDRTVFETVQAWAEDPSFADLFDGDRLPA